MNAGPLFFMLLGLALPVAVAGTAQSQELSAPSNEVTPPAGDETRPTAAGDKPWWLGTPHLGVQLHYGFASARMTAASRFLEDAFATIGARVEDPFGASHSAELSFVYETPWRARVQVGAAGLYDWGTFDTNAAVIDPTTGDQISTVPVEVTAHAWMVVVPILVGYRYPVWQEKLSVSADVGAEIAPIGGYGYTSDANDSPGIVTPGATIGWVARAGVAYQILPQLAVTLEGTGRGLKTGRLVYDKHRDQEVLLANGERVVLNFSGFGLRVGVSALFF